MSNSQDSTTKRDGDHGVTNCTTNALMAILSASPDTVFVNEDGVEFTLAEVKSMLGQFSPSEATQTVEFASQFTVKKEPAR